MSDMSDVESNAGGGAKELDEEDDLLAGPSDDERSEGVARTATETRELEQAENAEDAEDAAEEDDDYCPPDDEENVPVPAPAVEPALAPQSARSEKDKEKKKSSGDSKGKVASITSEPKTTPSLNPLAPDDNKDTYINEAYVMYAKKFYDAPMASCGTKAGRVRDYGRVIWVADGDKIAEMQKGSGWPAPEEVHPLAIVVMKGLISEGARLSTVAGQGPYVWYARVGIEGKPDGDDTKILRHIPRDFVKKFVAHLSQNESLSKSSLITKYQPEKDNVKFVSVKLNESFKERPDVKLSSAITKPNKKPPAGTAANTTAEDAETPGEQKTPTKGPSGSSGGAGGSGKAAASQKKPEKKQNTLQFARSSAPPPAEAKDAQDAVVGEACPSGTKRCLDNAADENVDMLSIQYKKRARIIVGFRKELTHVLWEGDNLYLIPFDHPVDAWGSGV